MELTMPFISVKSNGGPFDDESYAHGYQVGGIDALLSMMSKVHPLGQTGLDAVVWAANLPQLDLVAMRHGYRIIPMEMDLDGVDDPDEMAQTWRHVEFVKTGSGLASEA